MVMMDVRISPHLGGQPLLTRRGKGGGRRLRDARWLQGGEGQDKGDDDTHPKLPSTSSPGLSTNGARTNPHPVSYSQESVGLYMRENSGCRTYHGRQAGYGGKHMREEDVSPVDYELTGGDPPF